MFGNLSGLVDSALAQIPSGERAAIVAGLAKDGAMQGMELMTQMMSVYMTNALQTANKDELDVARIQLLAVQTVLGQMLNHAKAFRADTWDEEFGPRMEELKPGGVTPSVEDGAMEAN